MYVLSMCPFSCCVYTHTHVCVRAHARVHTHARARAHTHTQVAQVQHRDASAGTDSHQPKPRQSNSDAHWPLIRAVLVSGSARLPGTSVSHTSWHDSPTHPPLSLSLTHSLLYRWCAAVWRSCFATLRTLNSFMRTECMVLGRLDPRSIQTGSMTAFREPAKNRARFKV